MTKTELFDVISRYANDKCPAMIEDCRKIGCPFAGDDCTHEMVMAAYRLLRDEPVETYHYNNTNMTLSAALAISEAKGIIEAACTDSALRINMTSRLHVCLEKISNALEGKDSHVITTQGGQTITY